MSFRTEDDARVNFQMCKSSDPKDRVQFYDIWAETYEKDSSLMNYKAPHLSVKFLSENFSGNPEQALVLDVACGSGWVAKLMHELGFRHFVGVDGSIGMLEQAQKTGLYLDLKPAILGPEPLPAQPGVFDVVIIVGALRHGFVPVSIIRELHAAAKPGGLICMSRVDPKCDSGDEYKVNMERELQLMEEEDLWSLVATREMKNYIRDPYRNYSEEEQKKSYLHGTVYLYKKAM
ncbi:Williams-Beuren syndrome chromosomal region 27 protein-like isoform X2 [Stegastes partitus]|nr:PREDICTED: Williams-Beuren syndrome chromosomal region 27 protein-like isoform X2 [Stegastes partitus]XP_008302871.1 PREDICTED: Williams-Beuren syndrome chromosomal region 27 protein-like isoform X2 [Stegastes partitus]